MTASHETVSLPSITSILSLSAYLLEARDEEAILRAAMRAGCEILSAQGCLFVPFGEYVQTLPALDYGNVPSLAEADWNAILTHPSTRKTCKACAERQGGMECILFHGEIEDYSVHCLPLDMQGREAGLFSFIFSDAHCVNEESERLAMEGIHLTSLALDSLDLRLFAIPSSPIQSNHEPYPAEIETRAIIGERMRLAREIHDGLAQALAFLKIEMGRAERLLEQGETEQAASMLHESTRAVSDAYLDVRQIIENLRRVPEGCLSEWLQQVVEDYESSSGQKVELDLQLQCDIPVGTKLHIIRIVQEALTNVRKHAAASRVRVSAREEDGRAIVEVQDDGRGFAPDPPTAARFGLRGMRERAEAIGAEVEIQSRPSVGTIVRLHLPPEEVQPL